MPLKIIRRADTGALTIVGTIAGIRVRRRAQADEIGLAKEEAAVLTAEILRGQWHGERRGYRSFAEAVTSYLDASPRSANDQARLEKIVVALGKDCRLSDAPDRIDEVKRKVLRPGAAPATIRRHVITPIRAVLRHAAAKRWCEVPIIEAPKQPQGRTLYLLPDEAQALVAAAAPHLKPLLIFLLGTGARVGEALSLDWRDVDLRGARAIFWKTKPGRRRDAKLPPNVVAALASLPEREGPVMRWTARPRQHGKGRHRQPGEPVRRPYGEGAKLKTAFAGAIERAKLNPAITPHTLRHTWASWHYALHRDLLMLKVEGAWSSVTLVERYAHLLPEGHEQTIRRFYGWHDSDTKRGSDAAIA